MPFTPAHPAIVLSLLKSRYFSATGLIVGSISPDFEYFFKASVSGVHGHTQAGMFYFDLPVSMLLALIFHLLIKENLISNLPVFLQYRLQPLRELNFRNYLATHFLIFLVSVVIGTASHIFWDSFTHNGRFFVNTIPMLSRVHIPFDGARYPLWYVLQHISTVIGLAIILAYVLTMKRSTGSAVCHPKLSYWIVIILIGCVLFYLRFTLFTARFDLGNGVVTAMSSLMIAMCMLSFVPYFKSLPLIENNG